MARRAPGRRCGRVAVTVLACLSVVAVVQPAPARRDLFFDEMPLDGAVVTARRGADVVLDCRAIGTPIPTIHWLHRGRRLVQGRRHDVSDDVASYESQSESATSRDSAVLRLGTTKSRLFVDCVRPSDAGVYTCVADTPTRRITTTIVLRVVPATRKHPKLKRHRASNLPLKITAVRKKESSFDSCHIKHDSSGDAPARIYMWTTQRFAETGQQAQLYCRASGSPPPTVTWYDPDEREIRPDDRQYQVLPNGDLLISDVAWPENMGLYYCKVQNSVGNDVVDMFVYPTTT